ncbi:uncharacterized protein LOC117791326 [Drosophila innubila]|uniref:uncharacterized protein LOC117791326 n=1 Tax=Drosophila innubila TaxID=198719 RepID=UPI00148D72DE|nr:uncharacterized protein LOC117791326 [Drosophila innubila]
MLTYPLYLCCFVLLVSTFQVKGGEEHKLKLRSLQKIKEDSEDFQSSVQLSEPDAEGHVTISGDLKQHVTLDNEWKVNLTVYRTDSLDEEYVKFKELPLMGTCQLMSSYYKNFFYEKLKDYSNAPHPDNCPLSPQDYYLKDYPLDSSKFKKFLTPGYYRVTIKMLKENEVKLEYVADLLEE